MNNTVCRNFNYKERADGILELTSFNCERCKFDGYCVVQNAYQNAKDYVASMEIRGVAKRHGRKKPYFGK